MNARQLAGPALALLALGGLAAAPTAQAAPVGDIQAFYYAPNPFGYSSTIEAPVFVFQNTSAFDITDGVFTIFPSTPASDSFNLGTIAAGSNVFVEPGVSNDGGSGHTFFAPNGPLDTSDTGPDADTTTFQFTGLFNGQTVSTGVFTPATSLQPSGDRAYSSMNFLGNPDTACNDCYDPKIIATLATPNTTSAVPEPVTFAFVALGILPVFTFVRRRRA